MGKGVRDEVTEERTRTSQNFHRVRQQQWHARGCQQQEFGEDQEMSCGCSVVIRRHDGGEVFDGQGPLHDSNTPRGRVKGEKYL